MRFGESFLAKNDLNETHLVPERQVFVNDVRNRQLTRSFRMTHGRFFGIRREILQLLLMIK